MNQHPSDSLASAPVAAELTCPGSGARATGRVYALSTSAAGVAFADPRSLDGFDVGAMVRATFVSSVLGGSLVLRGRVTRAVDRTLELRFESAVSTPAGTLFRRRQALRLRPDSLPMGREAELAWEGREGIRATVDDISLQGVALIVADRHGAPEHDAPVRVRLAGPRDMTVWMSGRVRHLSPVGRDTRVGVEFDLRMADVEGAGPALHELVRQIERLQVDELVLAFAGITPTDARD